MLIVISIMSKQSAGILPFKKVNGVLNFFLVHPGGPFWAKKDLGAWSIIKGEFNEEEKLSAAIREFKEETGISIDSIKRDKFIELADQKLKSGKTVCAFALEIDIDPNNIKSNLTDFGWPEIDRGEWFKPEAAKLKLNPGLVGFIDEAVNLKL